MTKITASPIPMEESSFLDTPRKGQSPNICDRTKLLINIVLEMMPIHQLAHHLILLLLRKKHLNRIIVIIPLKLIAKHLMVKVMILTIIMVHARALTSNTLDHVCVSIWRKYMIIRVHMVCMEPQLSTSVVYVINIVNKCL